MKEVFSKRKRFDIYKKVYKELCDTSRDWWCFCYIIQNVLSHEDHVTLVHNYGFDIIKAFPEI